MITVFADQYLYEIAAFLPESINLRLFDPAQGLPGNLHEAQALLIRTVNSVNPQTLPKIPEKLSFIGTGSSGTDHVDQSYLKANDIVFADAAGCNARSVAEYVATGLLLWSEQVSESLQNLSVGIIGVGHVGTQVRQQLEKLHIPTICYDPPREERDPSFKSSSLQEALSCDIMTFHTPLITDGRHPTEHWLDKEKLLDNNIKLIINSARGGVVDEQALLNAHQKGTVGHFILDVWENEPDIRISTAAETFLKTPHIAGYSIQAKQNASKFIADALIDHFHLSPTPLQTKEELRRVTDPVEQFDNLSELISRLHPIKEYEWKLQDILEENPARRGEEFNKLRSEFPLRQQFSHIFLPKTYFERFPILTDLEFRLLDQSE